MISERQQALDGMAIYLANNKTHKELNELLAMAETNELKAIVRFAKKIKSDDAKLRRPRPTANTGDGGK